MPNENRYFTVDDSTSKQRLRWLALDPTITLNVDGLSNLDNLPNVVEATIVTSRESFVTYHVTRFRNVDATKAREFIAPRLEETGNLRIGNATKIRAPKLWKTAALDMGSAVKADVRSLEEVGGSLSAGSLRNLIQPELRRVDGATYIPSAITVKARKWEHAGSVNAINARVFRSALQDFTTVTAPEARGVPRRPATSLGHSVPMAAKDPRRLARGDDPSP